MANNRIKLARKVTGQSSAVPMTDELYAELSKSQQFLASLAEGCGYSPKIGEYQNRHFVASETIDELIAHFE